MNMNIYVEDIIRECDGKLIIGDSKKKMYKFLCYTAVSGFGVGYFPFASGTAGSFATLPFAFAAAYYFGFWGILLLAVATFLLGSLPQKKS